MRRRGKLLLEDYTALNIGSIVAGGLHPILPQLGRDVGGGHKFVCGAAAPSAQGIRSQKFHVRPDTGPAHPRTNLVGSIG